MNNRAMNRNVSRALAQQNDANKATKFEDTLGVLQTSKNEMLADKMLNIYASHYMTPEKIEETKETLLRSYEVQEELNEKFKNKERYLFDLLNFQQKKNLSSLVCDKLFQSIINSEISEHVLIRVHELNLEKLTSKEKETFKEYAAVANKEVDINLWHIILKTLFISSAENVDIFKEIRKLKKEIKRLGEKAGKLVTARYWIKTVNGKTYIVLKYAGKYGAYVGPVRLSKPTVFTLKLGKIFSKSALKSIAKSIGFTFVTTIALSILQNIINDEPDILTYAKITTGIAKAGISSLAALGLAALGAATGLFVIGGFGYFIAAVVSFVVLEYFDQKYKVTESLYNALKDGVKNYGQTEEDVKIFRKVFLGGGNFRKEYLPFTSRLLGIQYY